MGDRQRLRGQVVRGERSADLLVELCERGVEIGEPLEWLGWANMDQVMRVLAGEPPLESEKTPLRMFDASNVDETGTPANQKDGYGDPDEFKDGFLTIWGLN